MPLNPAASWLIFGTDDVATIATTNPYDLAEAIMVRAAQQATTLEGLTALYESRAGDRAQTPYCVYKIQAGPLLLTSDTHKIYDHKVMFTVIADTQGVANRMRDAIDASFNWDTGSLSFQTGYSIPFFETNRSEGEEPGRGSKLALRYRSVIEYSARTERLVANA